MYRKHKRKIIFLFIIELLLKVVRFFRLIMANLYIHTKFHETYIQFKKYAAKYGDILSRTNIICDRQGNIRCVQPNSIKNGPSWYLYYTYSLGIFRALIFWYILLREPGIVGKCKNIFGIFVSRIRDNGLSRFLYGFQRKLG